MNNPPAFPRTGYTDTRSGTLPDGDYVIRHTDGMTLRDYFAAAAMIGLLANQRSTEQWINEHAVISAFNLADQALREREK